MSISHDDNTTNATNNNNEENSITEYKKITVYEIPNSTKKNIPKKIIVYTPDTFDHVYSKAVVNCINSMLDPLFITPHSTNATYKK